MDLVYLLIIILINTVPAFLSISTWQVLVFMKQANPDYNFVYLIILGLIGSTIGRVILAKLFYTFIKNLNFRRIHDNIEFLESKISGSFNKTLIFSAVYCAFPTPSNILFIPAGKNNSILLAVSIGHVIGRAINYSYTLYLTNTWISSIFSNPFSYESIIVTLLFSVLFVFDWETMIVERKIEFIFLPKNR